MPENGGADSKRNRASTTRVRTRMNRTTAALLIATALHCAHAPRAATSAPATPSGPQPAAAASAEELVDHWGDSPQSAVSVPEDSPDGGELFENQWIFDQFGRFRRTGGGTGTLEGRRYNVVKIELASGDRKTIYFDITELWAKSLQQQP
jgi:hypothetical protein